MKRHDPLCFWGYLFTGEGDWEIRGGLGVQRMPSDAEFMSMQRLELWYPHLDENVRDGICAFGSWKLHKWIMGYDTKTKLYKR